MGIMNVLRSCFCLGADADDVDEERTKLVEQKLNPKSESVSSSRNRADDMGAPSSSVQVMKGLDKAPGFEGTSEGGFPAADELDLSIISAGSQNGPNASMLSWDTTLNDGSSVNASM